MNSFLSSERMVELADAPRAPTLCPSRFARANDVSARSSPAREPLVVGVCAHPVARRAAAQVEWVRAHQLPIVEPFLRREPTPRLAEELEDRLRPGSGGCFRHQPPSRTASPRSPAETAASSHNRRQQHARRRRGSASTTTAPPISARMPRRSGPRAAMVEAPQWVKDSSCSTIKSRCHPKLCFGASSTLNLLNVENSVFNAQSHTRMRLRMSASRRSLPPSAKCHPRCNSCCFPPPHSTVSLSGPYRKQVPSSLQALLAAMAVPIIPRRRHAAAVRPQ